MHTASTGAIDSAKQIRAAGPSLVCRGISAMTRNPKDDMRRKVPEDEIATAIARCAGCLADSVATRESIDSGEGRAIHYGASSKIFRPFSMSYGASAGRRDRQSQIGRAHV